MIHCNKVYSFLVIEFCFNKLSPYNYSHQPYMFSKFWKVPGIMSAVEVFFTEAGALTGSLQRSSSKQLFVKLARNPTSLLKKDFTINISYNTNGHL